MKYEIPEETKYTLTFNEEKTFKGFIPSICLEEKEEDPITISWPTRYFPTKSLARKYAKIHGVILVRKFVSKI